LTWQLHNPAVETHNQRLQGEGGICRRARAEQQQAEPVGRGGQSDQHPLGLLPPRFPQNSPQALDQLRPPAIGAEEDPQLQNADRLGGSGAEGLQRHHQVVQVDTAVRHLAHRTHHHHGEGEHEEQMGVPRTTAPAPDPLRPEADNEAGDAGNPIKVVGNGRLPAVSHSWDELKWILSMLLPQLQWSAAPGKCQTQCWPPLL